MSINIILKLTKMCVQCKKNEILLKIGKTYKEF